MKFSFLATWKMSYEGICKAETMMRGAETTLAEALCAAVRDVEDNPSFHSVGYGGYPNRAGDVQTDAAYMDGTTFHFGGVAGVYDIANPIDVAYSLSQNRADCFLCGEGAQAYARRHGHAFGNLLTEAAYDHWRKASAQPLTYAAGDAYAGHDTVCVLGKREDDLAVGVSTSGLFMKAPGRIGDSPVIGSGFYCESQIGGAAATGVGEDIMRGCLSFAIVRQMEAGRSPQEACAHTLRAHVQKMERAGLPLGAISVIAMDAAGGIGAATTLQEFAFVFADQDHPAAVWLAVNRPEGLCVGPADASGLAAYQSD